MPCVHRWVREMDTGSSSGRREERGGREAPWIKIMSLHHDNMHPSKSLLCTALSMSHCPIPLHGTILPMLITSIRSSTQVAFTTIQMPQVLMVLFPNLQGWVSRLFLPGGITWAGHVLWIFTLDVTKKSRSFSLYLHAPPNWATVLSLPSWAQLFQSNIRLAQIAPASLFTGPALSRQESEEIREQRPGWVFINTALANIPSSPITSCVTMGKLFIPSKPQFTYQ